MCGIIGIVAKSAVNQALYDGLTVLQHRGQDAAGIVTSDNGRLYMRKDNGLVRDVFHTPPHAQPARQYRHRSRALSNGGLLHLR